MLKRGGSVDQCHILRLELSGDGCNIMGPDGVNGGESITEKPLVSLLPQSGPVIWREDHHVNDFA